MKVLIVLGSARPVRNTPTIARIVKNIADSAQPKVDFELVDLKEWPIPYDAEESIPKLGSYSSKEVQAWSEKVDSADGFVMVTPQYNSGYPGVLKHALDVLYKEYTNKPVTIVTFGSHGGSMCNEQLRQVLGRGFRMQVTETCPALCVEHSFTLTHKLDDEEKFAAGITGEVTKAINELVGKLEGGV